MRYTDPRALGCGFRLHLRCDATLRGATRGTYEQPRLGIVHEPTRTSLRGLPPSSLVAHHRHRTPRLRRASAQGHFYLTLTVGTRWASPGGDAQGTDTSAPLMAGTVCMHPPSACAPAARDAQEERHGRSATKSATRCRWRQLGRQVVGVPTASWIFSAIASNRAASLGQGHLKPCRNRCPLRAPAYALDTSVRWRLWKLLMHRGLSSCVAARNHPGAGARHRAFARQRSRPIARTAGPSVSPRARAGCHPAVRRGARG